MSTGRHERLAIIHVHVTEIGFSGAVLLRKQRRWELRLQLQLIVDQARPAESVDILLLVVVLLVVLTITTSSTYRCIHLDSVDY
jgi:hypothetical protein